MKPSSARDVNTTDCRTQHGEVGVLRVVCSIGATSLVVTATLRPGGLMRMHNLLAG